MSTYMEILAILIQIIHISHGLSHVSAIQMLLTSVMEN